MTMRSNDLSFGHLDQYSGSVFGALHCTGGPCLMQISLRQFFKTFQVYLTYVFLANFIS